MARTSPASPMRAAHVGHYGSFGPCQLYEVGRNGGEKALAQVVR